MTEPSSLFQFLPIGREDSPETEWNQMREEARWVGKPWRRIELLTRRFFYKGEQHEVERDVTIHFGLRRFGIGFTFIVTRGVPEYGDERQ